MCTDDVFVVPACLSVTAGGFSGPRRLHAVFILLKTRVQALRQAGCAENSTPCCLLLTILFSCILCFVPWNLFAAIGSNLNLNPKYTRSPSAGEVICVAHCKAVVKICMPLTVMCIDLLFMHQHQP